MASYEFLEHTADVGVVATGRDFADALAGLAEGMFALIADPAEVREQQEVEVVVEAPDRKALVVEWLNELLYRYQAEGFLLRRACVTEAQPTRIRANCFGEPVDRTRHHINTDVKAPTYHQLKIEQDGETRIQVILDI